MSDQQSLRDELQEQHLDAMLHLAFLYADALEAQAFAQSEGAAQADADEAQARAAYALFLDKLARQEAAERKKRRIARLRRAVPKAIQIAACLILALGLAAPIAVAKVEAIRIKLMELLIDVRDDHTELEFVEREAASVPVPDIWEGRYYLTYLPEGFVLSEWDEWYCDVTYINEAGARIDFSELGPDDHVNINSEGAELSYETVRGERAFVAEHPDRIFITWAAEDRYFVIMAQTSREEALRIAESVRRIYL